ncbi:MAG: hypothetical protein ABI585_10815, partial [Betaproteobacteria bacterium]
MHNPILSAVTVASFALALAGCASVPEAPDASAEAARSTADAARVAGVAAAAAVGAQAAAQQQPGAANLTARPAAAPIA